MLRPLATLLTAVAVFAAPPASPATSALEWPPWLSVESPVNPFDPDARGAAMLVHTAFREGRAQLADLSGSAEGLVNGERRTIALRFEATSRPDVFALRRQWPREGAWVLRLSLRTTTAIVTLDGSGEVASVRVPTAVSGGDRLPRAVSRSEIDSVLAVVAAR